jgi:hypothetical protein
MYLGMAIRAKQITLHRFGFNLLPAQAAHDMKVFLSWVNVMEDKSG